MLFWLRICSGIFLWLLVYLSNCQQHSKIVVKKIVVKYINFDDNNDIISLVTFILAKFILIIMKSFISPFQFLYVLIPNIHKYCNVILNNTIA